jgi:uncharacterized protein (TIGR00369 family)
MATFQPQSPDFEARVRESFGRQRVMAMMGAELQRVSPGEVVIRLPFLGDLTQQHGFLHAGIVTAIADSACGYAALSLMPADTGVLTVEYKVNLLNPAGEYFTAVGRVVKPGRSVTVCAGDVFAYIGGQEQLVATMLATMMTVRGREGVSD